MDTRKVVKVGNSYYINIPSEISQGLGIMKGDSLTVINIPGTGFLVTRFERAGKISVNLEGYNRLQRASDFIYEQLKSRAKDLGDKLITDLMARLIPSIATSGIFDLKARVNKLEARAEVSDRGRGKVIQLNKKKRGLP